MSETDDVTVSPDEMAALMDSVREGADSRSLEIDAGERKDVIRYDLVAARAVGRGQLPTLDLINERLAGLFGDLFWRVTGQLAVVSVSPSESLKFVEASGNLPSPSCLQLLELLGLRGTGIICFDPSLLFHVFDLLLGGHPGSGTVDSDEFIKRRGMTAVEKRLFTRVTGFIGEELAAAWHGVADIGIRPLRVETDPRQLAMFEPNEMVVDTVFEIEVGGQSGKMHLIIPQASLRPVEKKLASGLIEVAGGEKKSWADPLGRLMREVTVQCTAELGRTYITVRDLMALKDGDVIRLDRDPNNPITLFVEGAPKLSGIPTLSHGNIAIEVVSVVQDKSDKDKRETKAPPKTNEENENG